jgi:hypothetical protein
MNAVFSYLDQWWTLEQRGECWYIGIASGPRAIIYQYRASGVIAHSLQSTLLLQLGKHKQEVPEKEAKREANAKTQTAEDDARKAREGREEQERRKTAEAEHQRLMELLTEKKSQTASEMWWWPEGVTVEISHMEYCKGSYQDEDEEPQFDYAGGWTASSSLDSQGRTRIEAHRAPYSTRVSSARVVQLMADVHRPVWQVSQVSSVDELPDALRQEVNISLEGVVLLRNHAYDTPLLTEIEESERYRHESWYSEKVGAHPLALGPPTGRSDP